jgi:hypothetical protein
LPTSYDFLVSGVGVLNNVDENPNAVIHAPRAARELALLKDAQLRPLVLPTFLDAYPRYSPCPVLGK